MELSENDKLMAAVCYWGNLILGPIPAVVILVIKQQESAYLKKHAIQSLGFNGVTFIISILASVMLSVLAIVTFGLGSILGILLFPVLVIVYWLYSLVLGLQVFQGGDPDIPYLTGLMRKYIQF